ncbi:MAG TPA: aminoglycoside phosphotransferase, partial [Pseudoxanthomonas sp.]|nr:aminoglycoside phosphotransferase [Pseudoxanthomonas sp.]
RDGKTKYLSDTPRFIAYLQEVLPRHPQLRPLLELLEQRIKPALQAKAVA